MRFGPENYPALLSQAEARHCGPSLWHPNGCVTAQVFQERTPSDAALAFHLTKVTPNAFTPAASGIERFPLVHPQQHVQSLTQ